MRLQRRFSCMVVLATIAIIVYFYSSLQDGAMQDVASEVYYYFHPRKSIACYRYGGNTLPYLPEANIRKGKSIFFHETSCRSHFNNKITLLTRQACAVESAARMNPNLDVYLTFSSPGEFKFEGTESDRVLQRLLEYKNIKIHHLNYSNYTKDTVLEDLYAKRQLEKSSFSQSHASDILRFLTLYKFGGIYLDMDVIVIKSLEDLPLNYAGSETDRNVAAGVLSFQHKDFGHDYARICLNDLRYNYKPHGWGDNGPGVITRMLRDLCNAYLSKDMVHSDCANFTVYPKFMFYPVEWEEWEMYFDPEKLHDVFRKTRDSYVIHVWNKHSEETKIRIGTRAPYEVFAKTYCPKVFKECDTYF